MRGPADRLRDARLWAERAEHDFVAAEYLMRMEGGGPNDVVSYSKALLGTWRDASDAP